MIDIDNNASTGCTEGGMHGVEQIFVTRVTTTGTTAQVTRTYRQVCSAGVFGAPLDLDLAARPAGYNSPSGLLLAESRLSFMAVAPGASTPSGLRWGFDVTDGVSTQSVLNKPNGNPIIYPSTLRRHSVGGSGARTFILDGLGTDWANINPLVQGVATAGSVATRILKIYVYANTGDDFLYFRFDGFLDNSGPFAQDDVYGRKPNEGLNIAAPGVLSNDGDGQGKPLTAQPVSPAEHGTVVLNPDGSFTYAPDNPASLTSDKFDYKASNGTKESNVARVTINVTANPSQPVVAGDDAYNTPEDTTLDVAAPGVLQNDNDPDGQGISATLLTNPTHGSVTLAGNGAFTYIPNPNFNGIDSFTYRVSDGTSTDDATVTITISNVNDAPKANNVTRTTNEEQPVSVTLSGSDPEGSSLTYTVGAPANGVLSGVAPNLTYTPAANFFGIDTFTYTVSDGSKTSTPATVTITVNGVNDVPSFTAGPSPITRSANAGAYSQGWATAISPGPNETGQLLNFIVSNNNNALFSVQPAISPTGVLTFTPAGNVLGSATVSVQLHDNGGTANGGVDTTTPAVTFTITITCPTITVTNPLNNVGTVGSPFSATFTQSGGIGAVTFTTSSTLPAGLTLAPNGTLSGSPTQTGTFNIIVTATDSQACTGTGVTYTLTINCPSVISVTNPVNSTGTAGSTFSATFTQSGGIGTITWSIASGVLPSGITLNPATGVLSGTTNQAGSFPITVTATDQNGCQGTGPSYPLTINCQTITVTNPVTNTGTVNAAFSATFTQTGVLGTATWSVQAGTLPAGLTLNPSTGVLSGTPTVNGVFNLTIRVTDTNGCFDDSAYTLTINCQVITVTNPANSNGTAGSAFSETFTQSGGILPITWSIATGTLPSGITLNSSNGVLSGTTNIPGSYPITVTATDQNGCSGTGVSYNLTIGCQTITVTNPANNTGTVNAAFSETFTQTGILGTATWSVQTGTLPAGLTLNPSTGVLSGTPTVNGVSNLTIRVTDTTGCFDDSAYTLTINCQTITVTNPANNLGTAGSAFSETFTQSAGVLPITWSIATGVLPSGITLGPSTGVLSGTTNIPGSYPITVTATDQNGCQGTGVSYNLTIGCQTITVTNPANNTGPAGSPFSETFTQTGILGTATWSVQSGTLPTGLTLNPSTGVLSGTPTGNGPYNLTIRVTDTNGCFDDSAYTLTLTCPTITVTNPANSNGTAGVAFSETFTQGGGIGTITWSIASGLLPSGITLNPSTGVLSGTTNVPGSFPITVTATDQNGCPGTGTTYNLTIACQTITVTNPVNNTGTVNAAFSETFTQTGILGTAAWNVQVGTLPAGLTLNPSTGVLSGTPTVNGVFNLTIRVTDTNGCFDDSAYTLTINCQTITVTNPANSSGTAGSAFSETFTQSGGILPITWSIATGVLPSGITLNPSTGVLSGTTNATGSFPITVTATDQNGCPGTGASYNLTIACQTITVTNPATNTGTVNAAFNETFTQTGILGTAAWNVQIGTLPAGLTLNPSTGVLSGTPTVPGIFNLTIRVTDTNGCFDDSAYTLTINCQAITVSNPVNNTGTVNAAFSETFTQTGIIGTPTWSVQSGTPPAGVTLNPSTGVLSGTPTVQGVFNLTIRVTDTNGCFDDSAYTLTINCQTINITNPVNANGTAGSPFSETFTQTGAIGTVAWTLDSGTLPVGINLNGATGALAGTTSQVGSFPVTLKATDQNGCFAVSSSYNLTIACQSISITNPTLNSVQAGTALTPASNWTFSATGILGTANWTVDSGTLPTGITLAAATGVLSGSSTQQGTFPVTIKVTDTNGCFTTSSYTLTVTCPTITPARTPVGPFPAGTIGSTYSGGSFTASGGTGPYTFAVTSGTFPTGLTLNSDGTISGTATATGTFVFTVTATDTATTCSGGASFSIAINPSAVTDIYNNLVNNTEAVVTGGTTTSPGTPFVPLTGFIIANDLPSGNVTVTAGTVSSANGTNNVVIAADGSFKYTPPVTVNALTTDSFTYTITSNSGGTGTPTSANGLVTLNLAGRVWYVNNSLGVNGNGQSQSPFNTTAGFVNGARATPDKPGDIIYIYFGAGTTANQSTGIALLNNEQLIGQGLNDGGSGFSLVVNGHNLVATGTKPLITNTGGSAVTLANGNTVKGLNVTGPTAHGVTGTNTAALTMDTMTIQGATGVGSVGLNLSNPSGAVTLTNTAISNSATGLSINSGTATTTINNTNTISSSAGQRSVSLTSLGATSVVNIGAAITDNGTGISVATSSSGASIAFTGTQTLSTTVNTAVNLANNTGATISFSGTLAITTTTGSGFVAGGGGIVSVSGTPTIVTAAATNALSLNAITIGGSGVTFNSITSTGAATAISLVNFVAAGNVTVNGGTITNGAGTTGISLQGTNTSLTLAGVTITGGSGATVGITNTTNFGTLTINPSAVNVSAATALNLTTGAISGMFNNVSSTGGTNGVNLNAVTGAWGATAGSLTGATGATFNVAGGGGGAITWGPSINQAGGANAVSISGGNTNIINFNGNVTTSGASTGIALSGSTGTYNFNGAGNTIAGTGGGVFIGSGQGGTISFATGTAITNATTSFRIAGTPNPVTANITYSGTISNTANGGVMIDINNAAGSYSGNLTMNGTSLNGNVGGNNGVISVIKNVTGTLVFNNLTETANNNNYNNTLVAISGANAGSNITFNNLDLQANGSNHTGKGLTMAGGGTLTITATGGSSTIDVGSTALDLNGIALGASTIATLNSLGVAGQNGVLLTSVTGGTLTITSGAITGNTAAAFRISGGTASVSYGGTITQNTAASRAIDISGITNGTVAFSGAITSNGGTGVSIAGTGGTVNVSGGMALNGTGSIFSATGAGLTVNVTGTNTIGNTTAATTTGVNITCTIGASGVTFRKVSTTGAANGVILNGTGAGNFTITGNGTANCKTIAANCDGGTIQTSTGAGLSFTTVNGAVSLTNVNVTGGSDDGIRGSTVGSFTLATSQVTNNGNAVQERGIDMVNLGGSGGVSNSTVTGNAEDNLYIQNTSTNLTAFNVTSSTFSNTSTTVGNDGIHFEGIGNSNMTMTVSSCVFNHNRGDHLQVTTDAVATATMNITFSNNTLTGDRGTTYGGTDLGGGITINPGGSADVTYSITGNGTVATPWTGAVSSAIMINASNGSSLHGTLSNNVIGTAGTTDSGSSQGDGISVFANNSSAIRALITNNTIRQYSNLAGLNIQQRSGSATVQAVVTGNTISNGGTFAAEGIFVSSGTVAGDSGTMCLDIGGAGALANSFAGSGANGSSDFRVRQRFNTTVRLPGYGGTNQDTAAVVAFIQGRNNGAETGQATVPGPFTGGGFIGGAACTAP